ncbi:MAG TPA: hypothetical protein VJY33_11905, partial [Isosphaeraceae bacterium]|nr:hypothetical protein [Isosphaeraceae bacterium]
VHTSVGAQVHTSVGAQVHTSVGAQVHTSVGAQGATLELLRERLWLHWPARLAIPRSGASAWADSVRRRLENRLGRAHPTAPSHLKPMTGRQAQRLPSPSHIA